MIGARVVAAVALHVFKVVPAPHAEEQVDGVAKKILAPLVHPGHFAQYCVDESCTHWGIVLCSSCGKLKLRIFTLFIAQNFHGLLLISGVMNRFLKRCNCLVIRYRTVQSDKIHLLHWLAAYIRGELNQAVNLLPKAARRGRALSGALRTQTLCYYFSTLESMVGSKSKGFFLERNNYEHAFLLQKVYLFRIAPKLILCLSVFCFLIINLLHAQCDTKASDRLLHGKWYSSDLIEGFTCFNSNSTQDTYYYGESAKAISGFASIDTITPWSIGERSYSLGCKGDTLLLKSFYNNNGSMGKDTGVSYILSLTDTEMIIMSYKQKKGIENHIDGVGLLRKDNIFDYKTSTTLSGDFCKKYILNAGFEGYVVINYDSSSNSIVDNNTSSNKAFFIPESGLLITNEPLNPVEFVKNRFSFSYANDINMSLPIIDKIVKSDIYVKTKLVENYLKNFSPNMICVVPLGYNEFSRGKINKKFGKDISGNTEIFYIGPLGNITGKSPEFHSED